MKLMLGLIFIASLSLTNATAHAGDWQLQTEDGGVSVFTRDVEDSDYQAFRGVTEVAVELNQVIALMNDTEACPNWMHNCKNPELIHKFSPLKRITFMVNDFPWPAKDRALLLEASITQEYPSRVVTVSLNSISESDIPANPLSPIPKNNAQPVENAKGRFVFTPLSESATRVEYEMHLEPGGSLPAAAVNALIVETPLKTLQNMQRVVKDAKYQSFRPF